MGSSSSSSEGVHTTTLLATPAAMTAMTDSSLESLQLSNPTSGRATISSLLGRRHHPNMRALQLEGEKGETRAQAETRIRPMPRAADSARAAMHDICS